MSNFFVSERPHKKVFVSLLIIEPVTTMKMRANYNIVVDKMTQFIATAQ